MRFAFHRFLDLGDFSYPSDTPPSLQPGPTSVTVASAVGLRQISYTSPDGPSYLHDEFLDSVPTRSVVSFSALRARLPSDTPHPARIGVSAIDAAGNINNIDVTIP